MAHVNKHQHYFPKGPGIQADPLEMVGKFLQGNKKMVFSHTVQEKQTLPLHSRESFTWIILKTSHFVCS